jgi:hypothetical protein
MGRRLKDDPPRLQQAWRDVAAAAMAFRDRPSGHNLRALVGEANRYREVFLDDDKPVVVAPWPDGDEEPPTFDEDELGEPIPFRARG